MGIVPATESVDRCAAWASPHGSVMGRPGAARFAGWRVRWCLIRLGTGA